MTVSEFALFSAVGRLLIWLIQTNGLSKPVFEAHPKLAELGECDLCLGFWVFLAMALIVRKATFKLWPDWFDCIIQAAISTFAVHLIRLGWQSKFGVTVI
jgi:hypothetical protein